ncbi:MAG: hypothetical protein N2111_12200 [Candidatus Sumerlaeaceae bacterium]|nr:hypothetical protein [Candidatus Sumerlaeaceae bacterium]
MQNMSMAVSGLERSKEMRGVTAFASVIVILAAASAYAVSLSEPVPSFRQGFVMQEPLVQPNVVYEHAGRVYLLRADLYPIKVYALGGSTRLRSGLCVGETTEVATLPHKDHYRLGGLSSVEPVGEALWIFDMATDAKNETLVPRVSGYSMSNFSKVRSEPTTLPFSVTSRLKNISNGFILFGKTDTDEAAVERRDNNGQFVWAKEIEVRHSLNRFTDIVESGSLLIATGCTLDVDDESGHQLNEQVFVCCLNAQTGDLVTSVTWDGDAGVNMNPLLAWHPSWQNYAVLFDSNPDDALINPTIAFLGRDNVVHSTSTLFAEPINAALLSSAGTAVARVGHRTVAFAFTAMAEMPLLVAVFDADNPNVITKIPMSVPKGLNVSSIRMDRLTSGTVLTFDAVDEEGIKGYIVSVDAE